MERVNSAYPELTNAFQASYLDLKKLARAHFAGERVDHTLQPTAVVHEVFVRLSSSNTLQLDDDQAFMIAACRTMREVLIDHARRRSRLKRGRSWRRVPLRPALSPAKSTDRDLMDLHEALELMERRWNRQARVAELQLFGGFSTPEIANALDISHRTAQLDWNFARAWLKRHLG